MNKVNIISIVFAILLIMSCGGDKKDSKVKVETKPKVDKVENSSVSSENRKGKLVYKQYCVICHGADGTLAVSGATDLTKSVLTIDERVDQITNGKGLMTPYKDILSAAQINSVAEYLTELRK